MAQQTFAASVKDWATRTKAAQEAVMRSSIEDVIALASVTQESARTRAGPARQGAFPVDTGHLVNTVVADLNGSGEFAVDTVSNIALTIESMEPGDKLHVAWTAAYAMRINSGFVGTDSLGRTYNQGGVHAVDIAAASWAQIVDANAAFLQP